MGMGLLTRNMGVTIGAIPGVPEVAHDWVDSIAAQYGNRVLTRIDPRDVVVSPANPTGIRQLHRAGPNLDPILFSGTGSTITPIAGLYNGERALRLTVGADAATINNLNIGPKSLANVTEFSVFGVAHFDAAMLGSGFHVLLGVLRDRSSLEGCLVHQFAGGKDYITAFVDQGDGGGVNLDLTTSTAVAANVPFAFLWRVYRVGGLYRTSLHVNFTSAEVLGGTGSAVPETSSIVEMMIGHGTTSSQQWPGGFARGYVVAGDALDTTDSANIANELMMGLRAKFAVP